MNSAINSNNLKWMKKALTIAKKGLEAKEVPVGCVLVYQNETVIGEGHNLTNFTKNPTRHAEFVAIDQALEWCTQNKLDWKNVFRNTTLYVTCEPCIMCTSALRQIGIGQCFFGCSNERFGGCGSVLNICNSNDSDDLSFQVVKGVEADLAIKLFQAFYSGENMAAPEPKCKKNRLKTELVEDDFKDILKN